MQGRAPIFYSAAGVGAQMRLLLSSDVVGQVQVLLKRGGQQNLQQVL
jgi:hypothetical protein